jgi:2-dehydro-3-deoxyphosphooctonate aldolase (KDO 8-P synthase)
MNTKNTQNTFKINDIHVGINKPLFIIAGPCVIESEQMAMDTAGMLKEISLTVNIPIVYKSSYDKANRSSGSSFRGLGIERGLEILAKVKRELNMSVLTDIHSIEEIQLAANVVDILQTPAFLCRQTDFIEACAACGKPVNFKKGQFLAPQDMAQVIAKARQVAINLGLPDIFMLCERGASFGYNNLVSDMRSLAIMSQTNAPIIYDATHSVQLPGGNGTSSGGQREYVPVLARAAVATGKVSGVFVETHPDPSVAKSDGPNLVPMKHMARLLSSLKQIHELVQSENEQNGQQALEDVIQSW